MQAIPTASNSRKPRLIGRTDCASSNHFSATSYGSTQSNEPRSNIPIHSSTGGQSTHMAANPVSTTTPTFSREGGWGKNRGQYWASSRRLPIIAAEGAAALPLAKRQRGFTQKSELAAGCQPPKIQNSGLGCVRGGILSFPTTQNLARLVLRVKLATFR